MELFDADAIDYSPYTRLKIELSGAVPLEVTFLFKDKDNIEEPPLKLFALFDLEASYSTIAVFPKVPITEEAQLSQIHHCIEVISKGIAAGELGRDIYRRRNKYYHYAPLIDKSMYNDSFYIYSSTLPIGRDNIRTFFAARGLRARVRDVMYYQEQWEARRPDIFISHDSADKATVAEPLYHALTAKGLKVWLDKYTLNLGDSLTEKINEGITECRYGVLILSKAFLANERWAKRELNSFSVKDAIGDSHKLIPVWHGINESDLAARGNYWLLDKLGGNTSDIQKLAEDIFRVVTRT